MMRILIVHQYYLARDEGGGSRFNQMAKHWSEMGHDVTVIAGTVHYATGRKKEKYRGKWLVRETDGNGIRVLRTYVSSGYNRGFGGRVAGYLSFALSASWAGLLAAGKQDLVLATSPPLTVAIPGYIVSRMKRIPLLFEVRDLWPDFAVETDVMTNRLLIRFSYWLERTIYRKAKMINVLTPGFRQELLSEGVPDDKIVIVPNGADLDLFRPDRRENAVRNEYGWDKSFVVLYTGAHGRANALDQILDAAELMRTETEVLFVLVGDGMEKPRLVDSAQQRNLTNVQFIETQPKERMKDFINGADVCIATLADVPGFRKVYPNKLFDYMSCARPIILGIDGVARDLVEQAEAGVFAEPECPQQIVEAVREFRNDEPMRHQCGKRGYDYVRQEFSREQLARDYVEILQEVARRVT